MEAVKKLNLTMVKKIIWTILMAILLFLAVFYLKEDFLKFYHPLSGKIEEVQKIGFNSILKKIETKIFTPSPLWVDKPAFDVVLTKNKIIWETNLQRRNNGLSMLTENKKLSDVALAKANDMFLNQYFEHVSPSGVGPEKLIKGFGYDYIVAGENLILGNFSSEKELVDAWMISPDHRENILNARYTEIGVAVVKGIFEGQSVWIAVQEFGAPISICPEPDIVLKDEIEKMEIDLDNLYREISERLKQIKTIRKRDLTYNQLIDEYNELVNEYNLLIERIKNLISQYNSQVNVFNRCLAGEE